MRRSKLRTLDEHMLPNLHIYKEAFVNLTLLDTQKKEAGAVEATGGLADNGQLVTAPK